MNRILSLFLSALVMSVSAFAQVNFPDIENFTKNVDETIYKPDNLWDLINGAAETYIDYDFRQLEICEYTSGAEKQIRVEVYRHKDLNCAFGIYAKERNRDYRFIDVGTEGYTTGDVLNFFVGRYYVKCSGNDAVFLNKVAGEMVVALKQPVGFPKILQLLPKGKIPHSEGFVKQNFLGYSVLLDFFTARYGADQTFFISKKYTDTDAKAIVKYLHNMAGSTRIEFDNGKYILKDPYAGKIYLYLHDEYVFGVIGGKKKEAELLLEECVLNISGS